MKNDSVLKIIRQSIQVNSNESTPKRKHHILNQTDSNKNKNKNTNSKNSSNKKMRQTNKSSSTTSTPKSNSKSKTKTQGEEAHADEEKVIRRKSNVTEIIGSTNVSHKALKSNSKLFTLHDSDQKQKKKKQKSPQKKRSYSSAMTVDDANIGKILIDTPAKKKAKKSSKVNQILDRLRHDRLGKVKSSVNNTWPLNRDGSLKEQEKEKTKEKQQGSGKKKKMKQNKQGKQKKQQKKQKKSAKKNKKEKDKTKQKTPRGKEKQGKDIKKRQEYEMTEIDMFEGAPVPQPDAKFGEIFDPFGTFEDPRSNANVDDSSKGWQDKGHL